MAAETAPSMIRVKIKNAINPEPLGFRCSNFQDFLVLMISTYGVNFKKIWDPRVSSPGWFDMEWPIDKICQKKLMRIISVSFKEKYDCDLLFP